MCTKADHDALKLNAEAWRSLTLIGRQRLEATDTEPAEVLELRNCRCGSTLARTTPPTS